MLIIIETILSIVNFLFELYGFGLVVYVLMSWFPGAYNTKIGLFLNKICEPYLSLFNFIPPIFNISFAPVVALMVLSLVQYGAIGFITWILNFI